MKATKKTLHYIFSFSLKDCVVTLLWIIAHTLIGIVCGHLTHGYAFGPIIYLHCTFVIALTTKGYILGCISAVSTVFLSNFFFSYPRLTISTAPDDSLSYLVMLIAGLSVVIVTSTYQRMREAHRWSTVNALCVKLIRAASHDLRTPLTSISGATTALMEENNLSDDAKKNLLVACHDEADNLIRTIENLVVSSKVLSGKYAMNKTDEIVDEVLSEIIGRHCSNPDNPAVVASIPQEILIAPMDVALMKQALTNLLAFVSNHADCGSEINIGLTRDGKMAKFVISYRGEKIKCSTAGLLFDLGSTDKRVDLKNVSLELSSAASIIREHDGTFNLENKSDCSEITFRIPILG